MIVTVTANAAIDRTIRVPALARGRLHRADLDHSQAGGKGVNVARVLRALGVPAHAVVVVGGASGEWIVQDLARAAIPATAVRAAGDSRTCLEIVEHEGGLATQIHGAGVVADDAVCAELVARVGDLARGAEWVVICGSLPRGAAPEVVARLVECARTAGARVALDTSGEGLRAGWRSGPDLVRVNRREAREALGCDVGGPGRTAPGAPRAGFEVISDGPHPVLAWAGDTAGWRVAPPAVGVRNPIGCGDTMLAGMLAALRARRPPEDSLRDAVALAAAQAESWLPARVDLARAGELTARVRLERL